MQVVEVKGISFIWSNEKYEISGRGMVHLVKIFTPVTRTELGKIVGEKIEDPDGVFSKIIGIESRAIELQWTGAPIGLLLEPLEKPF